MNITEFLEARIDEDETRASSGWARLGDSRWETTNNGQDFLTPSAVLSECAAKRAIIVEHEMAERSNGIRTSLGCMLCNYDRDYGWEEVGPCKTLRALASVYATHADYQQEWA